MDLIVPKPDGGHEGHRQRLKQIYLEHGLTALDDKEVIELLLTYAVPRRDVYGLSRDLVHHFGSADLVLAAPPDDLREFAALSEHSLVLLNLIEDLRRDAGCFIEYRREQLTSVKKAFEYCRRAIAHIPDEVVVELFLDKRSYVTDLTKMSYGTSEETPLPINRIVRSAVMNGAERVLIAHNHPSGSAVPSSSDVYATNELRAALREYGIELVEHIIVTRNECTAISRHLTLELDCEC